MLERYVPGVAAHALHVAGRFQLARRGRLFITRSGYTGEDGFEISLPGRRRPTPSPTPCWLEEDVEPIGLGARDSLRLEAGLCLYGHDIDATTSPIEAALNWSISQAPARGRRLSRRGAHPARTAEGMTARSVGLALEGKAPAREGAEIADARRRGRSGA